MAQVHQSTKHQHVHLLSFLQVFCLFSFWRNEGGGFLDNFFLKSNFRFSRKNCQVYVSAVVVWCSVVEIVGPGSERTLSRIQINPSAHPVCRVVSCRHGRWVTRIIKYFPQQMNLMQFQLEGWKLNHILCKTPTIDFWWWCFNSITGFERRIIFRHLSTSTNR